MTLPFVAVIEDPPEDVRLPTASASNVLPVPALLEPVKFNAPVLFRNTSVAALAVTLATCDTSSLPAPLFVPIEPEVEVTLSRLAERGVGKECRLWWLADH